MRRLRGGGKLAGVQAGRRRRSAAWERGERKGASEIESWVSCSAQARERSRAGPLVWALHGGGEVAAGGGLWARGTGGGGPARSQGAVEEALGDAWATAHDELMAGKAGKPLHGAGVGAVGGRRRKTEQGVEVEDKGSFAISKNSRDPTIKQR